MKYVLSALLFTCFFKLAASAQQDVLDIPEMYQLIDESKDEHKFQVDASNQQATNTANEQVNLTLLGKVKSMYRTLQNRYNTLGTVINLAEIGLYATPMIRQIVSYQGQIVTLVQKDPAVAFLGYRTEIEFVGKAEALGGYVAGLLLSLGDVNQMKASDRKLLFDYVVQQLSRLQELSGNLLRLLQYKDLADVLRSLDPFASWISQDKSMVNNILNNAKYLK
jgi:hypothetical protein